MTNNENQTVMETYCTCDEFYRITTSDYQNQDYSLSSESQLYSGDYSGDYSDSDFSFSDDNFTNQLNDIVQDYDIFGLSISTIIIICMVIGIPLNLLILIVPNSTRKKIPRSSFLLLNMAIIDLIILTNAWITIRIRFTVTGSSWNWINHNLIGRFLCKMHKSVDQICLIGSDCRCLQRKLRF